VAIVAAPSRRLRRPPRWRDKYGRERRRARPRDYTSHARRLRAALACQRHPHPLAVNSRRHRRREWPRAGARSSLRSTMFSEIQLAQSAPAAGTIQRQINHCCARTASNLQFLTVGQRRSRVGEIWDGEAADEKRVSHDFGVLWLRVANWHNDCARSRRRRHSCGDTDRRRAAYPLPGRFSPRILTASPEQGEIAACSPDRLKYRTPPGRMIQIEPQKGPP
jgi:hypothetical protein